MFISKEYRVNMEEDRLHEWDNYLSFYPDTYEQSGSALSEVLVDHHFMSNADSGRGDRTKPFTF